MKVFLSGGISIDKNYRKKFYGTELFLSHYYKYIVLNPCVFPLGLSHDEYMHMCYAMIDVSDSVYFLKGWDDSVGSQAEMKYAIEHGKQVMYEEP